MDTRKEIVKAVYDALEDFEALGPRVVVLRAEAATVTRGGLIIPDEAQKRQNRGTIIELGTGYEKAAEELAAEGLALGMEVWFNAFDGVSMSVPNVGPEKKVYEVLIQHAGNIYMRKRTFDPIQ